MFQIFAKLLTEKVREVNREKIKTSEAIHGSLPKTIVCAIKRKKVVFEEKMPNYNKMYILILHPV